MEPEEFWASTPRELAVHTKTADRQRDFLLQLHAGIQATLHNAHFRGAKDRAFTPEMFLPGAQAKPKEPQWKRDLAAARAALVVVKRPDAEAAKETIDYFSDRTKRASEAKRRGESREVIDRIMTGAA